MEDIKNLLGTIVEQLDSQAERDLRASLNQDSRDVVLNQIHSSIEALCDTVLEAEYKLDQIELRLDSIEKHIKKQK